MKRLPDGHAATAITERDLEPRSLFSWFGTAFAMLETPGPGLTALFERSSRGWDSQPEEAEQAVSVHYHLGSTEVACISTRRAPVAGTSVAGHLREVMVNYQLRNVGGLLSHLELMTHMEAGGQLDLKHTPETLQTGQVHIDGQPQEWTYVTETSIATGRELTAFAAHHHGTLIAAAGAASLLTPLRLTMWSPA